MVISPHYEDGTNVGTLAGLSKNPEEMRTSQERMEAKIRSEIKTDQEKMDDGQEEMKAQVDSWIAGQQT
jgi:hypothetical protein